MLDQINAPSAFIQPAEPVSGFATGLKAMSDRIQRCRDIAAEMGLPPLGNFPSDYAMRSVEQAYADHQTAYHEWLDEREIELSAREAEHADEMGDIRTFA